MKSQFNEMVSYSFVNKTNFLCIYLSVQKYLTFLHSFKKKMSTEMAVSVVSKDIITNVKNEQITRPIFFDLRIIYELTKFIFRLKIQAYNVTF